MPSNAFGSGQSYLCFSRTGQDKGPQLARPPARQSFFGAADLDIAGLANGKTVTLPRIYSAAHADVHVSLAMDRSGWTNATAVTLEVSNAAGGECPAQLERRQPDRASTSRPAPPGGTRCG